MSCTEEDVILASADNQESSEEFRNFIAKPKGLHWVLLCTLPILDVDQASITIQYYARRWQIERFPGCPDPG